jgi:hypothetical protein
MNRSFPIARLLILALVFAAAAAPAARAQAAKSEMKQPPTAVVSLYRIAPGKQLDFLKWMAELAAINKEAGVPADHWYAHTNGDSWDYLHVAPDLSSEQQAKVDEVAKKHGRKTGFAATLDIRAFVAWHTDTFVIGPVSAAELVSAAGK